MRVKNARLAQAIPGTATNMLESKFYELTFDKGMLTVKLKSNPKKYGDFIVFPANIAWLETAPEEVTAPTGQVEEKQITDPKATKKK